MIVKLKRAVIYRGRQYQPGEDISADPEMVTVWKRNNLVLSPAENEQEKPVDVKECPAPEAVALSAPTPPGIVEGGSGAEGEMPGRDSRKKGR